MWQHSSKLANEYAYWSRFVAYHLYNRWIGRPKDCAKFLFRRAVRRVKPGALVIDCGANIGDITCLFGERGAQVHAFEPDPYAFARLQERAGHLPNVVLMNAAVGPKDGSITLYRHEDFVNNPDFRSQSSSIFADKARISPESAIDVPMIDIAAYIKQLGRNIYLLKMDIEGAEVAVIEHLLETDTIDHINLLFAETHEDRVPSIADRTRALRQRVAEKFGGKINLDWV